MNENNNKWFWSGWAVAGILGVVLAASGFQAVQEKTGVVDFNKLMQQSNAGQASTKTLNSALAARRELIDFVNQYKVLTVEQATRLKELKLKPTPTAAETQEIQRIENDVKASDKRRADLTQKATLTDQDRAVLQDFAQRAQMMGQTLDRWNGEFQEELSQMQEDARNKMVERARAALQDVAKQQGFSVVFESQVAVYGANDLTEAAMKAMNAKP